MGSAARRAAAAAAAQAAEAESVRTAARNNKRVTHTQKNPGPFTTRYGAKADGTRYLGAKKKHPAIFTPKSNRLHGLGRPIGDVEAQRIFAGFFVSWPRMYAPVPKRLKRLH